MNGAFFDPESKSLSVYADINAVSFVYNKEKGTVVIDVENLDEGIEVFHAHDRLWRPV